MNDLLLDSELSDEQREYAETVRNSAEALLGVINDVLDFSKIEAGRVVLEPIPFDLRTSVEEVAEMLAPRADQQGLELIIRYKPGSPTRFIGDAGRIRQVLTNLLGNALKFTDHGHVLIDVEYGETTGQVVIRVQDTGIGIEADELGRVFEKFTQADASATRRYGGTGLGLTISKELVERMNGTIGVESRVGQGSTFWFSVPLTIDSQPQREEPSEIELDGVRVLVVDDNPVNRRVLLERLTSWRMHSGSAASGGEALETLRAAAEEQDPYDIALVDFHMPVMDGESLGRAVKRDRRLKHTVLVMQTSVGRQGDAERMRAIGFGGCLPKPVRCGQLRQMLEAVWLARQNRRSIGLVTRHSLAECDRPEVNRALGRRGEAAPRTLIVEDNSVNQRLAEVILEKLGCDVDLAANGRQALEKLEQTPYDLIFMDCQMPELDGYETTREIRSRDDTLAGVPIIAMTAHAMPGDRQRCLNAGMDDYLAKRTRQPTPPWKNPRQHNNSKNYADLVFSRSGSKFYSAGSRGKACQSAVT
jgi:CheY-like chemotaxis protein